MLCSKINLELYYFIVLLHVTTLNAIKSEQQTHIVLQSGKPVVQVNPTKDKPIIFCYVARPKQLSSFWETASIHISLDPDNYDKFEGTSIEEVLRNFKLHQSSWTPSIIPFWKQRNIKLDPFNSTCVGIVTSRSYEIVLNLTYLDNWQLFKFIVGVVFFFYASKLSDNQLFYYICGISLGICGSVIILIYLFSRLLPSKMAMYGVAIGGWTMSVYFLQYLLENIKVIIVDYYQYVFGYVGISGVISFAICYRLGPLSNPRSKKLIQWSLKIAGLILIFYSSHIYEVTFAIDLILVASRITFFAKFFSAVTYLLVILSVLFVGFRYAVEYQKKKLFRPRVKLLTKKEYVEQGRKETKKALEELRGYCSSPECNQWKTVLRLKNPVRFAEFVEGSLHVSEDEIEEYGSLSIKPNGTIITDDSDNSVTEFTEEDSF